LRTRTQTDRRDLFEAFGVDARRDLLYGITGAPRDTEFWGGRVSGSDMLAMHPAVDLEDLGDLCEQVAAAHAQEHYLRSFGWIDQLAVVTDPALREQLLNRLITGLQDSTVQVTMTVPEVMAWDEVSDFRLSFEPDVRFVDPEDADLSAALHRSGRADDLTQAHLRRTRLEAFDGNGEMIRHWTLMNCLSGELDEQGRRFVLSDGEFFEVSLDLLGELREFVDALPQSPIGLPPSNGDITEELYNANAAEAVQNALLMDRKNVWYPGATSPVEVCDLLTSEKRFVHVKRKLGSAQLSHLFSQGARSLELCVVSRDFRAAALQKIGVVEEEVGAAAGTYRPFDPEAVDARTIFVDYAIIARWAGRAPSEALPFFSQLNLRRFVQDIEQFGAHATLTRVDVE
jgi:uncharacterized protein (TIGR04141 family)